MRRFNTAEAGFAVAFEAFLAEPRGEAGDVSAVVADILAQVRAKGFDALAAFTERFDRCAITSQTVRVDPERIAAAVETIAPDLRAALELAAERIRAYHHRQIPEDHRFEDPAGLTLAWRWTPIDAVGLYVPGGRARYPSSVLMNAIPAKTAGVGRLAMTTPAVDGALDPLVLAAAHMGGVDEIYTIGGAQAVAALAYGCGPIAPVDKIVGPGNAYVAEAKRQVFGHVGIDTIAGPSEILVVADAQNDPDWIAADLLSQAEHDDAAQSILITDEATFADAVAQAVERRLETLPSAQTARASWERHGAIVTVGDVQTDAAGIVDQVAPEHAELAVADPDALAAQIRHAGAIFLGRHAPEAIGDYVSGSNHVLPTARAARFSSGLSTLDFMKRTSLQTVRPEGLAAIGPAAARLAQAEGLPAHALSVSIRTNAGEAGPRD
ncbi:MAG: histidinol dehydrogenase [Maricaulaceae bacterium]